ncbi:MAG TPA: PSD1 and planctomycete cytochrome C domain-containing protein, partial [Lacipirellulaceae bacterium]|nr:PSD1 and planctomycete cytochrome C domain-containing protein [Lacipirellulaceae bacterium]
MAADTPAVTPPVSAEGAEFFEAHIRPVLVEKCYSCHSSNAKKLKGDLRLDSAAMVRKGGESGPVIVPGKPADSPLISALKYESNEMPPGGKLPDAVIADFEKWVAMGAPDPRVDQPTEPKKANPADHWSYKRPQKSSPPEVAHAASARNNIDRFILAKLEAVKLSPSPVAPPRVLLRRLYYDLIGLPPSADELDQFSADPSDARYDATVDRLLASPRFGERWARYWLDVARYADTKGYVFMEDRAYKGGFAYRDWVINSFNVDRPYDQFIVDQIAADQTGDASCAPATGFLTLGRRFLNSQPDIINDRIDVISRGILGMTVACARCHDHKYDPIPAADYYALYGVLASSEEKPHDDRPPELVDSATLYDPYVFLRGNPGNRGPNTERRFLTCLSPDQKPTAFKKGSGRRELADDLASRDNPLTARVWVNRVWDHLFGKGIVDTPSDFGVRGTLPTHPELLDTLACQLMDDGWSTKRLIRRIVTSSTYRQASDDRADCAAVDAENRLVWRVNRRRLDLEALRDSLLVVAGRLDEKMGGPSVSLTDPPFSDRRSVYGYIERQNLPAFFRTFDFANPNTHTPERPQTTAPQQALFLMNSAFTIEQASSLADRTEKPGQPSSSGQNSAAARVRRVERMFRDALGREPSVDEISDALDFVDHGDSADVTKTLKQLAWQFGWGNFDESTHAVQFQPYPRFIRDAWQGGEKIPDPALGWATINATGGHPGDAPHSTIRRWVAPAAGQVRIEGLLAHPAEPGDGVRGRIIATHGGIMGSWDVHHGELVTNPPQFVVDKGDAIDFIVDSRANTDSDTFNWTATLRLKTAE